MGQSTTHLTSRLARCGLLLETGRTQLCEIFAHEQMSCALPRAISLYSATIPKKRRVQKRHLSGYRFLGDPQNTSFPCGQPVLKKKERTTPKCPPFPPTPRPKPPPPPPPPPTAPPLRPRLRPRSRRRPSPPAAPRRRRRP